MLSPVHAAHGAPALSSPRAWPIVVKTAVLSLGGCALPSPRWKGKEVRVVPPGVVDGGVWREGWRRGVGFCCVALGY